MKQTIKNLKKLKSFHNGSYGADIDRAIKALEQEPCGDCISRQAVLDILKDKWNMFSDANDAMQESIDTIEALSPVTPQPKTGRWIYTGDYITDGMLKCSECNFEHDVSERFSFCPSCGVKMESEG